MIIVHQIIMNFSFPERMTLNASAKSVHYSKLHAVWEYYQCCMWHVVIFFSLHISQSRAEMEQRGVCGLQRVSFAFVIRSVIPWGGSQMHILFHTAAGLRTQTLQNKRGRGIKMHPVDLKQILTSWIILHACECEERQKDDVKEDLLIKW